jgi:hypothetical protein
MFYTFCLFGIVSTLICMMVALNSPEKNVIRFCAHDGCLYQGEQVLASYRQGSRNFQLLKHLAKNQGKPIPVTVIAEKLNFNVDSKTVANLRLPKGIIDYHHEYIQLNI